METLNIDEQGKMIPGFPGYYVTNYGRIFNVLTGREMALSPTLQGDLTVGLVNRGHQYRREVKLLVAKAFVEGETELFNTPIQFDGDKSNLRASNITWRPRWFAWKYTRQFNERHNWYVHGPIVDLETFEEYPDYMAAAIENGILCADIRRSIYSNYHVFPTGQNFAYVN